MTDKPYAFETLVLHAGHEPDPSALARAAPVYRTSSYVFKSTQHAADLFWLKEVGNIYTRIMNPTQDILEKRVAALEGGGVAVTLSSGTSAVFYAVINICSTGDEVISAGSLYGGTYTMFESILPQFGIKVRFVDPREAENFESAVSEKTRMIFVETIGNPVLQVPDLEAVSREGERQGGFQPTWSGSPSESNMSTTYSMI